MDVHEARYVSGIFNSFSIHCSSCLVCVNRWPSPASHSIPTATAVVYPASSPSISLFSSLPTELFLSILSSLSLVNILSFSATCRSLRTVLTSPSWLAHTLIKPASGELRWLLPVRGLMNEEEHAYAAARLWFPEYRDLVTSGTSDRDSSSEKRISVLAELLAHPEFPIFPFLRACWESDSMKNRRRLWGIVKQFDTLWKEYRTNGPKVHRFFPSEEILACLQRDEVGYRPMCEV